MKKVEKYTVSPPGIEQFMDLCKDAFYLNYGKNIKGFIVGAYESEVVDENEKFVIHTCPLKGTNPCDYVKGVVSDFEKVADKYIPDVSQIYYYNNLLKNADKFDHFNFSGAARLKYDHDGFYWRKGILEKDKKEAYENIKKTDLFKEGEDDYDKYSWEALEYLIHGKWDCHNNEDLYYHNDFDMFFFPKEELSSLVFIPIPILSSITLFYILSYDEEIYGINTWEDIYKETRYLILYYIFNNVSKQLSENTTKVTSESTFVEMFVNEIAKYVLPLAYCISDEKCDKDCICYSSLCKEYAPNCPNIEECTKDTVSETCKEKLRPKMLAWQPCPYRYKNSRNLKKESCRIEIDLPLNETKKKYITFFLPSFVVPHSMKLIQIQDYPGFSFTKTMFETRIVENFNILYGNWKKTKKIQEHATRTIIAKIMGRNLSHNIGSHVLIKASEKNNKDVDGDNSKHLFKLIQKRMEFIANGTYAASQSPYKLFSEILPAYLERETDAGKNIREDLMLLFDYISGNDNIKSSQIKFVEENADEDFLVSIPGGVLGFQAIYILLENIIRNSSKHNTEYPTGNILQYSIKVENDEQYKDFYKITITDNFGIINRKRGLDINQLNDGMNEPILSPEGTPSYWGLLEMKICATFLKGFPIDDIDIDIDIANQPTIKKNIHGISQIFPPSLILSEDADKNLVHTFYLQKPQIAAIKNSHTDISALEGFEKIDDPIVFEQIGSKHEFAVFDCIEDANKHEKTTNQRSVVIPIEEQKRMSEDSLWEKYATNKGWNSDTIKIISEHNLDENLLVGNKYIILDNHDLWFNRNKKNLLSNPSQLIYYEHIKSKSLTKESIVNKLDNNYEQTNSKIKAQIFEMALTGVIVLDERIQRNFKDKLSIECSEYPIFSNLFIPPLDNVTSLNELNSNAIIEWIKKLKEFREDIQLNYLVVHRSLIGEGKLNVEELENCIRESYGCNCILIYTSVGGTPPNLKDGEYYLPFEVLNYCIESKFALVSILKSLRKTQRK